MSKCNECGKTAETRPYGKNGAAVCFDCAMATPETKAEAERRFMGLLAKAFDKHPVVVLDNGQARGATYAEAVLVEDVLKQADAVCK